MEWLMRKEGPIRERSLQPEALIESSCRVRLDVRGMNCAMKASKMGSPGTPAYSRSASVETPCVIVMRALLLGLLVAPAWKNGTALNLHRAIVCAVETVGMH